MFTFYFRAITTMREALLHKTLLSGKGDSPSFLHELGDTLKISISENFLAINLKLTHMIKALGKSNRSIPSIYYKSPTHYFIGQRCSHNHNQPWPSIPLALSRSHNHVPEFSKFSSLQPFGQVICYHLLTWYPLNFTLTLFLSVRDEKVPDVDVAHPLATG
jgi:hypothetical protein